MLTRGVVPVRKTGNYLCKLSALYDSQSVKWLLEMIPLYLVDSLGNWVWDRLGKRLWLRGKMALTIKLLFSTGDPDLAFRVDAFKNGTKATSKPSY